MHFHTLYISMRVFRNNKILVPQLNEKELDAENKIFRMYSRRSNCYLTLENHKNVYEYGRGWQNGHFNDCGSPDFYESLENGLFYLKEI